MRLVLMGPPGCGKGTQADLLADRLEIPKISSGDLFRARAAASADPGVQSHLGSGTLVPDDETIAVVEARLALPDAASGFVLDGFPRTLPQALALDAMLAADGLALDGAMEFHVPADEIVQRLSGRRTCPACGRSWHLMFNPATDGRCGECGSEVVQRVDDQPETIAHRLEVYAQQTLPIVDHYRAHGILATVDGAGPIDVVLQQALTALTSATH